MRHNWGQNCILMLLWVNKGWINIKFVLFTFVVFWWPVTMRHQCATIILHNENLSWLGLYISELPFLIFSDSFSVKICILMLCWRGAIRYCSSWDADKVNSCNLFFSWFCLHEINIAWYYFENEGNSVIPDHRNKWPFFLVSTNH